MLSSLVYHPPWIFYLYHYWSCIVQVRLTLSARMPVHHCVLRNLQFLLGIPKAEQASRSHLRVSFFRHLFIFVCTSLHFWHYRSRLGTVSSPQHGKSELDCLSLYMLSSSQSELFNAISLNKMPRWAPARSLPCSIAEFIMIHQLRFSQSHSLIGFWGPHWELLPSTMLNAKTILNLRLY